MKNIIKTEEVAMFGISIYFFLQLPYSWVWFWVLLLTPDVSMIGYVFGNKAGAVIYNFFHHKGVAIAVWLSGVYTNQPILQLVGVILFAHSSMDRIFGYGLKYDKGFKFTHLGEIGK